MMFIGSVGDEVTPIAWTTTVARRWPGSTMLRVTGGRHGAVATNACAALSVSSFLLTGILPVSGTVCL